MSFYLIGKFTARTVSGQAACKLVCRHFARGAKDNFKSKFGGSGRPSAIDLVDHLDVAKSEDPSKPQSPSGGKLRKGLQAKEKPILDMASQGSLEATGEDVREIMNEFLESAKFAYVFKGIKKASTLVTISKVVCNRDISHTTALWKSNQMELFVKMVDAKHGEAESAKITTKIVQNIDRTLRAKEGAFRSFMMRKMDFKRVPRISFHAADPTLGLTADEDSSKRYSAYNSHEMSDGEGDFDGTDDESGADDFSDSDDEDEFAFGEEQEEKVKEKPSRHRR